MKKYAALGAVIGLASILGATPASAAGDTTPPTLAGLEQHYRVGQAISTQYTDNNDNPCTPSPYAQCASGYFDFPLYLPWKASDASGICSEAVGVSSYEAYTGSGDAPYNNVVGTATPYGFDAMFQPDPNTGEQVNELAAINNTVRQWNYVYDTWDDGRDGDARQVRVTDCAGNIAVSPIFYSIPAGITDDNDPANEVTYSGAWNTTKCLCFSGGTTHSTSALGASTSYVMSGRRVALVMERAANRGSADIYIDGVKKATVNTYSAKTVHQTVVWEALVSTGTFHTVKVVNKATAGHPRIDVDAFLHS